MRASMRRARRARGRDERRSFGRCVVGYVWGGEVYGRGKRQRKGKGKGEGRGTYTPISALPLKNIEIYPEQLWPKRIIGLPEVAVD